MHFQRSLFAAANFVVGCVLAILVALSNTPVVGIIIPLLFGLATGGAGFLFYKYQGSKEAAPFDLSTISISIISLCTGFLLFLIATLTYISQPSTISVAPVRTSAQSVELVEANTSELLEAIELRFVARKLGASNAEIAELLEKYRTDISTAPIQSKDSAAIEKFLSDLRVFSESDISEFADAMADSSRSLANKLKNLTAATVEIAPTNYGSLSSEQILFLENMAAEIHYLEGLSDLISTENPSESELKFMIQLLSLRSSAKNFYEQNSSVYDNGRGAENGLGILTEQRLRLVAPLINSPSSKPTDRMPPALAN